MTKPATQLTAARRRERDAVRLVGRHSDAFLEAVDEVIAAAADELDLPCCEQLARNHRMALRVVELIDPLIRLPEYLEWLDDLVIYGAAMIAIGCHNEVVRRRAGKLDKGARAALLTRTVRRQGKALGLAA